MNPLSRFLQVSFILLGFVFLGLAVLRAGDFGDSDNVALESSSALIWDCKPKGASDPGEQRCESVKPLDIRLIGEVDNEDFQYAVVFGLIGIGMQAAAAAVAAGARRAPGPGTAAVPGPGAPMPTDQGPYGPPPGPVPGPVPSGR
ncbi:hypothetical protein Ppa06_01600 [Planomonospora parontospora subsp. parontospora]|nr:hypothetical protein [Planomonospora parontospora]GII06362.1 hypothetical protein Ppa06_01600 [Planomonospora parontospora subsp. parontospora]